MPKLTNQVQPRGANLEEMGKTALTNTAVHYLNSQRRSFLENLGFDLGENLDQPIPKSGSVPRMFVIGKNERGGDQIMDLAAAGLQTGTAKFWEQVQLGNVFAYAVGELNPVQLQLDSDGNNKLQFSAPIAPENLPKPPAAPRKPTPWMRFAGLFGGYKRERAQWNEYTRNRQQLTQTLNSHRQERGNLLSQETKDAEEAKRKLAEERERREEEDRRKAEEETYKTAVKRVKGNENSMKLMTSIFQPQPVLDTSPGILRTEQDHYGLYRKEQFNDLVQYPKEGPNGIDLDKIQVGKSGETVKPEEFAAVTMYALWQPEALKAGLKAQSNDPHMVKSLTGLKDKKGDPLFKEEDVLTLATGFTRGWWTTDLFMNPPRDNEGAYFKDVTNVGRRIAVEAFQDYAKGDNTKLAKLVADGINMAADDLRNVEGACIFEQQRAVMHTSGKLLDLLAKDPALAAKAKDLGMKPEKVQIVKGLRVLENLEQESRKAEVAILEAHRQNRPLTEDEKRKYIKAMLKPRIAVHQLGIENMKCLNGDLIQEKNDGLYAKVIFLQKDQMDQFQENPASRPAPKEGEIWADTAQNVSNSLAKVFGEGPQILLDLGDPKGNALKQLDIVAEEVYKVSGAEKMKMNELARDLDVSSTKMNFKLTEHLIKATDNLKNRKQLQSQQDQPQADKTAQMEKQNNQGALVFGKQ